MKSMQQAKRVVVTGMGCVTPLGCDVETVWRRLLAAESGVVPISRFDASEMSVRIAAEVRDFDPLDYLDKRASRRMDLFARYAAAAAVIARDDAGLAVEPEAEHIGACIGSGVGGLQTFEHETRRLISNGPDRVNPLLIPMLIPNMAAAHVSLTLGTRGPLTATCTACAAGSNGIGDAFEMIRRGDAVAMFAGGSEAAIAPVGIAGFAALRALSTRNDAPAEASRPFDAGRDGFVMGEGGGVLVLEELEHARSRGAHIYVELVGYGMSSDAFHMTAPDETGRSQARAMTNAMAQAGVQPAEIGYLNAHGTSTPAGDIAETKAIKIAFGDHARDVAVSSSKSMIGHCLGGSGGIEAIVVVMTIVSGQIHPTVNLTDPDPDCDLDFVPLKARSADVRVAGSNSFGFGGHNVTLLFKRFED
jgi:3-oxoacyl-[acyl-carrier-protein] synthase II